MKELKFIKLELKSFDLELAANLNGREGVDFLIGTKEIHLQSIDLDSSQRSIKISKQDLRGLKDNLFVALISVNECSTKGCLFNSFKRFITIR